MEKQHPLLPKRISPEDWENTPEKVKRLVESLLASAALAENKSHLTQFLDATPIGIAVHDSTGQVVYINHTGRALLGTDRSSEQNPDCLSTSFQVYRATSHERYPIEALPSTRALAGESIWVDDLEIHRPDRVISLEVRAIPIFDDQVQVVYAIAVFQDIGDRRAAETHLRQTLQRENLIRVVTERIRQSLDLDAILKATVTEVRQILQTDRVLIFQLEPDGSGQVVQESVDAHWQAIVGQNLVDPCFQSSYIQKYFEGGVSAIADIDDGSIQSCHAKFLKQFDVRANLVVPIIQTGYLWGLLIAHECAQPRQWSEEEIQLLKQLADQVAIAIHQANLYQQVQLELEERRRVEVALRESEARFQNMAANVPGAIFRYLLRPDGSNSVLYVSAGCYHLWEIEAQDVVADATVLWQMIHPEDVSAMYDSVMESARTLNPWVYAWRIRTSSGREKWLEAAGRPIRQPNGDIIWDTMTLDVSDRKQAEAALRKSEARYRLLAENTNDLVCLHELTGRYLYVSPSCETLLGYRMDEMKGQDPYSFIHSDDRALICQQGHLAAISRRPTPITYRMRQKSGNYIWFETLTKPITNAAGQIVQLQTTSRDVTERIQVEHQLKYAALHDALTGLPNRHLLMERLELAINRAKCLNSYHFAVLFIDLDRFKVINDSLGHLAGDQLLIVIAQKLQAPLREIDIVTRLGGDEFVILLEEIKDIQEAARATERIFAALQTPLTIEGREVYVTASIGIVLGTKDYAQASHLLRDADIAMYRAKARGKARYEVFNPEMHTQALNRLHLENDLRRAIEYQEFVLHYQPIVALATGHLVGFEALIRWQHPAQGLKSPAEFIPIAEETGLITLLDYWVLRTACDQLVAWQTAFPNLSDLKMSVNLSAQDLQRSDLLEEVDRVLAQTHLKSHCLTLEITESILIEDIDSTISLLRQLKEREIQISIDDFGTGYSSLSYLYRLPVNNLKVDRSFVNQIQSGKQNYQIVETIVRLCDQLELNAIAEGIETPQQLEQLQHLGYEFGQGYLFSKPLSHEATEALLASKKLKFPSP